MLLQHYQRVNPVNVVKSFGKKVVSPIPKVGGKVRLKNLRKSLSVGTFIRYEPDETAPLNRKGQPQNWVIQMDNNNQLLYVTRKDILKVLT